MNYYLKQLDNFALNSAFALTRLVGLEQCVFLPKQQNTSRPLSSVAFICKGNICRSAYAENRLRKLLLEDGLNEVRVASFGLETTPGKPADCDAIRNAEQLGIDLTIHRTAQADSLDKFDLVLCMEPYQLRKVKSSYPQSKGNAALLGAFVSSQDFPLIIKDPFGGTDEAFKQCFKHIDTALASLAQRLFRPERG